MTKRKRQSPKSQLNNQDMGMERFVSKIATEQKKNLMFFLFECIHHSSAFEKSKFVYLIH